MIEQTSSERIVICIELDQYHCDGIEVNELNQIDNQRTFIDRYDLNRTKRELGYV